MRKKLTRGHVIIGLFLFTVLCVFMVFKISSALAIRVLPGEQEEVVTEFRTLPPEYDILLPDEPPQIVIHHIVPPAVAPTVNPVRPPLVSGAENNPIPFYPRFPIELARTPIPADPWDMLIFPRNQWRDNRFELFSWDRYPEILIIDLATLAIQERFFHRLAFFVEKADFRGTLWYNHEIGHLHGWNAHNYQASDLANFFQTARRTNFPLHEEEWELEAILLRSGVLALDAAGNLIPGRGAILTLTQESVPALRTRFMAHEVFHGLFFIDADFREFSRDRWEIFPEFGQRFLKTFFAIQEYCLDYEFLLVNEFMGHLLQLPIAQVPWFFGQHVPGRLFREGFAHALPERYEIRDGVRFWPDLSNLFVSEAEVFSRHVYERWGLEAGRVWRPR